jgi:hypothetical protein
LFAGNGARSLLMLSIGSGLSSEIWPELAEYSRKVPTD